ncbi:4-(cytidine 5'-diphospho)-2-C-methyl-D-erythritol kinase [Nocardioides panacisoli]|uniref:4-diphosphocytidyl-2-C-methyl-D-erythritol kinase n=1 Tax=Nocardioides panacisoli TaxID=627624 RepID=A0ABP7HQT6_9ACTN
MSAEPLPDPLSVTVRAPAKINLFLGVGRARPDGFHPLETLYQAVSLYDDVTVTSADEWSVRTVSDDPHVDLAGVPEDEDNIAVRAGKALVTHHGVDRAAAIEIRKGIPVAGGMAGGSADAAATLLALDRLWNLQTSDEDLLALAAGLGSDVPFALVGGTAHGTGRGEVVTPVEDNGTWWWVVVFNEIGLPTPTVYAAFDVGEYAEDEIGIDEPRYKMLREADPDTMALLVRNDLEDPAFDLRKDLERTAEQILTCGATTALLSGSGPTLLGAARDAAHAREIVARLAELGHENVMVANGPVAGAHVVSYN